jgi:hypothetical protein
MAINTVTFHNGMTKDSYGGILAPDPETWEFFMSNPDGDVHIFEDTFLPQYVHHNDKIKIAMIIEVPVIYDIAQQHNPNMFHPHKWILENHHHFDYVFSAYRYLADIVGREKYHWTLAGDCRILKEDQGMYEKERLISAIASFKRWTKGHALRHEIIDRHREKIDAFGSGYNNIINEHGNFGKVIALAPYCFTVVVANDMVDDYFSEQLTDALCVGTVPIYWGTNSVKNYFNIDGIIQFETIDEFDKILPTLTIEKYQSMMPAILDNLERVKNYGNPMDWLYNNKKDFLQTVTRKI